MLQSCRKFKCPPSLFVRAWSERTTLEQELERFHQIKGLSLRFRKQPLPKAFQVRCLPSVFPSFPHYYMQQEQDVFGGERAKLQASELHGVFHASSPHVKLGPLTSCSQGQCQEE